MSSQAAARFRALLQYGLKPIPVFSESREDEPPESLIDPIPKEDLPWMPNLVLPESLQRTTTKNEPSELFREVKG